MKQTTRGDLVREMPDQMLAGLIKDAPLFRKYPPAKRYQAALAYLQEPLDLTEEKKCQEEFTKERRA